MSDRQNPALDGAWADEHVHVGALFGQWTAPVLDAAVGVLSGFVVDGGRREFDAPAHIVTVPA
jgi:hypothetical protein